MFLEALAVDWVIGIVCITINVMQNLFKRRETNMGKIEIGAIVAVIIAIIGLAIHVGRVDGKIDNAVDDKIDNAAEMIKKELETEMENMRTKIDKKI